MGSIINLYYHLRLSNLDDKEAPQADVSETEGLSYEGAGDSAVLSAQSAQRQT